MNNSSSMILVAASNARPPAYISNLPGCDMPLNRRENITRDNTVIDNNIQVTGLTKTTTMTAPAAAAAAASRSNDKDGISCKIMKHEHVLKNYLWPPKLCSHLKQ